MIIRIGKHLIGGDKKPFIIAEAGVNHNGRISLAHHLIDVAANCRADAVKFQTYKTADLVTENAPLAGYQKNSSKNIKTQHQLLKKLELKEEYYPELIRHCKKKKIIFLSTPHGGIQSAKFLNKLGLPAFKLGSGDITNEPLIKFIAKLNKPMIISTGMANIKEILTTANWVRQTGNNKLIFLQATTNYPCPPEDANLAAIITIQKQTKCLVGFSDHTLGSQAAIIATALGASVIEKHFTTDKNLPGPDHRTSIEPDELKKYINDIILTKIYLGSNKKLPTQSELKISSLVRKSIIATATINKDEIYSTHNIGIKRPSSGLPPIFYNKIIGQKARRRIQKNSLLKKNDF